MKRERQGGRPRNGRDTPAPRQAPTGGEREAYARPKRSLGQNFLSDPNIAAKIVAALAITAPDTVVEIGPGRGALTPFILAAGPGSYLALEKDRDLAVRLAREHPGAAVAMVDALRLDWRRLDSLARVKVVGNLPYNIASPLLWDLCAGASRFDRGVFMVQHEVARRLAALPGGREYGALSAWVQAFARVDYLFKVPPTVFRPMPKVDSAVVAVTPLPADRRPQDPAALAGLLKQLFSLRRKQLGSILKGSLDAAALEWLAGQALSGRNRPEELSPRQLTELAILLKTRSSS
ncbi:MAG: 16S rRNA (adenine(1518)-N(6)/adenine(1519)-N(6))-dimethyltransferase RsmA [Solidesulfovibrio sp. DCME]|uniref:16S rRNA (adenine(1518)-N(6)/adenine(1519)-N(6))- dimethyltransferase RsmA n=1 Tax=Solidesulfovibrio sp. DCME TaxID=3447380 RepID=UPI003D09A578